MASAGAWSKRWIRPEVSNHESSSVSSPAIPLLFPSASPFLSSVSPRDIRIGGPCSFLATDDSWQVYPLFAATGVAVGICAMQLIRNITTNPEVRVTKENRAAGILENFDEGKRYSRHGFRQFIDGKRPEIMPGLNSFMADPKQ
ncbi:hypothetical protein PR202_ga30524 [Eleusine coracana subsp. coracana]|uniref:NADH-ubiquinone reductase complex 1 MLRQ subunit n=1 Tax=Eleusine coracana subsp. coracana TaxID=191504 RepID=A0AAV5DPY0_ELECO|nr:hypothetical protein PR202_ga30490 [Eleusine coracana subsp. coracana]GJN12261.1 hypothetical protein PR202_ga30524 [Eleusine coracana subsp. coracana]